MKHLKLSAKIGAGFAVILLLTMIVGVSGYLSLGNVVKETDFFRRLDRVKESFAKAEEENFRYLLFNYKAGRPQQAAAVKKLNAGVDTGIGEISAILETSEPAPDMAALLHTLEKGLTGFKTAFSRFSAAEKTKDDIANELDEIFKGIVEQAQFMDKIKLAANLLKADCEGYFQRQTEEKWQVMATHQKALVKVMQDWGEQAANNAYMKKIFDPLNEAVGKINGLLDQYKSAVAGQAKDRAAMEAQKAAVSQALVRARDLAFGKMDRVKKVSDMVILVSVAVALGLGVLFALLIISSVVKPVREVTAGLAEIATGDGDLTQRLTVNSQDEVGQLAGNFNRFMARIQSLVKEVAESSVRVDAASGDLTQTAAGMEKNAEETSGKANTVAAASEELSANMNSVAAAMAQASTNADTVSAAAGEMTATINEIAGNAANARNISQSAVSDTWEADTRIKALGRSAEEIGKVVSSINDISAQVGLLALNATIEAARAGDAGRGFGVVANEIKDLAGQTATASEEIKTRVDAIQSHTQGAVDTIAQIQGVVTDVNAIVEGIASAVEEQSISTKEIADNVGQVSAGIQEVTENVAQSNMAVTGIAKEINRVNRASGEITTDSHTINQAAEALSDSAGQLNSLVGKFKI